MTSHRCLVTGASRGVGLAIALALSEAGHAVALNGRDRAALEAAADRLPGPTLVVPGDVTDPGDVAEMFATVESEWGPVEVFVANAGSGGTAARVVDTDDDLWQSMLDLNLTAPFRCIRRALPGMLEQGWGRIVVVASVVAKRGEPLVSAYTASKHGVLGLVRSAAAEVAGSGVTVNAVCPGFVDTPMTDRTVEAIAERRGIAFDEARSLLARRQPIGRLIDPDEVATAVRFCVDNAAVNGQGITIDGGSVQS